MSIEKDIEQYKLRCRFSIEKIKKLDSGLTDKQFRDGVNEILSKLDDFKSGLRVSRNEGLWSIEEKKVLIDLYKSFPRDVAYEKATQVLNRTAQQIRSMAGNIGL